jgi:hypothetical protein
VSTPLEQQTITKADIQAKLDEIAGTTEKSVESAKSSAITAGIAIVAVVVIAGYLLGRRRGRKTRTFVEIRRI